MKLSTEYIEKFAECYCGRLQDHRISYYVHDKDTNHSKSNAIHSGIIWSREAVSQLNSIDFRDKKNHDLNHLILLITYIDILLEATDQIYRVLYKQTKHMPLPEKRLFNNRPTLYGKLNDRDYFKEIRALLSAHPINLQEPDTKDRRFADIPIPRNPITDFKSYHKIEGDFDLSSRLWTATRHDENTIHFPIRIIELETFASMLNDRYIVFLERLRDIAYKRIQSIPKKRRQTEPSEQVRIYKRS